MQMPPMRQGAPFASPIAQVAASHMINATADSGLSRNASTRRTLDAWRARREQRLMAQSGMLSPTSSGGSPLSSTAPALAVRAGPPEPAPLTGSLVFKDICAFAVPDGDLRRGSGKSDPYVKFTIITDDGGDGPTAQTEKIANADNPVWKDPVKINLPRGFTGQARLRVRIWDDDVTSEDDAIGSVVLNINVSQAPVSVKATLKGREQGGTGGYKLPDSRISFTYELEGSAYDAIVAFNM